jgi:opacity protein-like surface antigen
MKHILYAGFLISAASLVSFSNEGGFYLSAEAGVHYLNGEHTFAAPTGEGKETVKKVAFAPHIGGGYIYLMANRTYVGADIHYLFQNSKKDINLTPKDFPSQGKATLNHKSSFQGRAYFGMMLNPRVGAHVSLALEKGKIEATYKNLTYGTQSKEKYSKNYTNIIPGLGVMYRFNQKLFAHVNYQYVPFKKITFRSLDTTVNGAQRGCAYKPNEHRLTMGLLYKF